VATGGRIRREEGARLPFGVEGIGLLGLAPGNGNALAILVGEGSGAPDRRGGGGVWNMLVRSPEPVGLSSSTRRRLPSARWVFGSLSSKMIRSGVALGDPNEGEWYLLRERRVLPLPPPSQR
jgi:hypothetical protein